MLEVLGRVKSRGWGRRLGQGTQTTERKLKHLPFHKDCRSTGGRWRKTSPEMKKQKAIVAMKKANRYIKISPVSLRNQTQTYRVQR